MKFNTPLIPGKILKRYKRFLADVELKDKSETVVAHVANTGSMKTCWEPGQEVMCSYHDDPKRKLKYGLQMVHNGETWILVNTSLPNKLAVEGITSGVIEELDGYSKIKPEVKTGKSRIDILLEKNSEKCFVEVKNVTMLGENATALFPDAVSTRGQKHLVELMNLKKEGHRACMLYIVNRGDVDKFSPAKEIDPDYSSLLKQAEEIGVEIIAYQTQIKPEEVLVKNRLPIVL